VIAKTNDYCELQPDRELFNVNSEECPFHGLFFRDCICCCHHIPRDEFRVIEVDERTAMIEYGLFTRVKKGERQNMRGICHHRNCGEVVPTTGHLRYCDVHQSFLPQTHYSHKRQCSILHKKQVLAELENDKDSIFYGDDIIKRFIGCE
jgi:hypothetical protein